MFLGLGKFFKFGLVLSGMYDHRGTVIQVIHGHPCLYFIYRNDRFIVESFQTPSGY